MLLKVHLLYIFQKCHNGIFEKSIRNFKKIKIIVKNYLNLKIMFDNFSKKMQFWKKIYIFPKKLQILRKNLIMKKHLLTLINFEVIF